MARYAILDGPQVVNVILASAETAPQGAIACSHDVGPGWTYQNGAFTAPAKVNQTRGLDQGQFRLLFTFAERQAEAAYKRLAEAAAAAGTATNNQLVYLTMRDDFDQAGEINLDDPATLAALDFYVAFGLLAEARRAQVVTGERPA